MKVVASEKLPIKMWVDDIEGGTLEQAKNLANLPFAYRHIALMPDCHQGYGMPIGGVMATRGAVVPNAVGVDIGCGMCAVRTNIMDVDNVDGLQEIVEKIKELVPVGFNSHEEPHSEELLPDLPFPDSDPVAFTGQYEKARRQLGTLGGGNHFIELQRGADGFVWVMIHSGSRNLGKRVADHHNKVAKRLNAQWHSAVPAKWDLAFLPLDTPEAEKYLAEMDYCVQYAQANREMMLKSVQAAISPVWPDVIFDEPINIAHNYAATEHHFGKNVMVHRKGATRARDGELGIIPGSQGTQSYIVRGKGNPVSFESCSHGAGRCMGRKQAIRELDFDAVKAALDAQGVIHSIREAKDLDEAPDAYKDIAEVMANQADLVDIVTHLTPLAVVKG